MKIKQTKKTIIEVRNLSKKFDNNIVLEDINFDLYEGESLAIIGASGSGKSVLLKNIIGLLKPDKGSIKINNIETVNLSRAKKEDLLLDLGIAFQHGALFDSLKVWENIIFKIQRLKKLSKKDGQKIALVGVENWGKSFKQAGDLSKASEGVNKNDFKILMSHDPSHWEAEVKQDDLNYHLTLSGHTHGLQMGIEIPGWFKWSPSKYVYKQWAGLYEEYGRYINVNRGFGYHAFPGRVGIWPEITVIELKKE